MKIEEHHLKEVKIAEIYSDKEIITNIQDGLEILGNVYYQGFDCLIIYKINISPIFFDLKSGIAGEILQKFSNYKMRLFIVGDFTNTTSKSLRAFIYESNKGRSVNFVNSKEDAMNFISQK